MKALVRQVSAASSKSSAPADRGPDFVKQKSDSSSSSHHEWPSLRSSVRSRRILRPQVSQSPSFRDIIRMRSGQATKRTHSIASSTRSVGQRTSISELLAAAMESGPPGRGPSSRARSRRNSIAQDDNDSQSSQSSERQSAGSERKPLFASRPEEQYRRGYSGYESAPADPYAPCKAKRAERQQQDKPSHDTWSLDEADQRGIRKALPAALPSGEDGGDWQSDASPFPIRRPRANSSMVVLRKHFRLSMRTSDVSTRASGTSPSTMQALPIPHPLLYSAR